MCECAANLAGFFEIFQKTLFFYAQALLLVAVFMDDYAWKIPIVVYIEALGRCLVWIHLHFSENKWYLPLWRRQEQNWQNACSESQEKQGKF